MYCRMVMCNVLLPWAYKVKRVTFFFFFFSSNVVELYLKINYLWSTVVSWTQNEGKAQQYNSE